MAKVNFEIKSDDLAGNYMEFGFVECNGIYSRFFLPNDNNGKLELVLYTRLYGENVAIGKIYSVKSDDEEDLKCKITGVDLKAEELSEYVDDMISIKNFLKQELVYE